VGIDNLGNDATVGWFGMQTAQHLVSTRRAIALAMVGLALVGASPAQASDTTPADNQYGGVLGEQTGGAGQGGLPFTGLNLLVITGVGAGLAAAGVGIRSAARRPHES
jgi:hypothetical protein